MDMASVPPSIPSQSSQEGRIIARPAPLTPGQDQLRLRPYRIRPLAPFAVGPTSARLILGTRSRGAVTGGVRGDEFFSKTQAASWGSV